MSLERRVQRLEAQCIRQEVASIAQEYGVSAEKLLEDARLFFGLSEVEQDAEFGGALAQAQARGDHEAVRLLTEGWAAVRSYR
jgi:hypothetical protein